jgi:uncharacterized protein (DUF302 family)
MTNMTQTAYGFGTVCQAPYDEVVSRVKEALRAEGFGVLTEIDVRQTLKQKLGVDMPPYLILGACNPPLAHRALTVDPDIGLLLPCNVVVRADGEWTKVDAADPVALLGIVDKPELQEVGTEARQRMQRVIAALA